MSRGRRRVWFMGGRVESSPPGVAWKTERADESKRPTGHETLHSLSRPGRVLTEYAT